MSFCGRFNNGAERWARDPDRQQAIAKRASLRGIQN
jgi:hypothetical protein